MRRAGNLLRRPERLWSLVLLAALAIFVIVPLVYIVVNSFMFDASGPRLVRGARTGDWTLFYWMRVLTGSISRSVFYRPAMNSLLISTGMTLIAMSIGALLAWVVVRTDLLGKRFFSIVLIVPYIVPSWTVALAWIMVFKSKRFGGTPGLLNYLFGMDVPEWVAYGYLPMIIALGIHYIPYTFILVRGVLANIDSRLEESAEILGAGRLEILRRITFPLALPALGSAFVLTFSKGLGEFGTQAFLGLPVRCYTLSTRIYSALNNRLYGEGYVLAFILIVTTAATVWMNQRILGSRKGFVTVEGKGSRKKAVKLGPWRLPTTLLILAFVAVFVIAPLALLGWQSLMRVDGRYGLDNLTLHYWIGRPVPGLAEGQPGIFRNALDPDLGEELHGPGRANGPGQRRSRHPDRLRGGPQPGPAFLPAPGELLLRAVHDPRHRLRRDLPVHVRPALGAAAGAVRHLRPAGPGLHRQAPAVLLELRDRRHAPDRSLPGGGGNDARGRMDRPLHPHRHAVDPVGHPLGDAPELHHDDAGSGRGGAPGHAEDRPDDLADLPLPVPGVHPARLCDHAGHRGDRHRRPHPPEPAGREDRAVGRGEKPMSSIVLSNLSKRFGATLAVDNLDLTIRDGEFLTLLGPSGCGKTTTLRCLSGLEEPDDGVIEIGGRRVFSAREGINLPPGKRGLGLVFQNYALWPHMKVGQNVAFGLRRARLSGEDQARRVSEILQTVGLDGYEDRYPHELSGGQQQRVAVARMVVTEPKIFLFDEPLSNLDAKLRMRLRSGLKRLHLDLGATTVYVTHDQVEAMALSDRIVVMREGVIQQAGTPYEVYHFPANLFVAEFMGNPQTNLIRGEVGQRNGVQCVTLPKVPGCAFELGREAGLREGQPVILNVRPEDFEIDERPADGDLSFRVYTTQPMGSEVIVDLRSERTGLEIMVKGPEEACRRLEPEMRVSVRIKRGNVLSAESERLVASFGF